MTSHKTADNNHGEMAGKLNTGADELIQRAQDDMAAQEHRYVYSESSGRATPGYVVRPNKKGTVRKVSTFYLIIALFGIGASTVAYVNNVIVVNRLAAEINQLQSRYNKISNTNAVLKSDINRKSGWDRIGKMAGEQVGLRYLKEPPTLFDIDRDVLENVKKTPASK